MLVDGAQSAGAIPVDVPELGCDFYTVSGQKWLLGPDGTGALYVRPELIDELPVPFPSYFSQQGYEETGAFAPRARRRALTSRARSLFRRWQGSRRRFSSRTR